MKQLSDTYEPLDTAMCACSSGVLDGLYDRRGVYECKSATCVTVDATLWATLGFGWPRRALQSFNKNHMMIARRVLQSLCVSAFVASAGFTCSDLAWSVDIWLDLLGSAVVSRDFALPGATKHLLITIALAGLGLSRKKTRIQWSHSIDWCPAQVTID